MTVKLDALTASLPRDDDGPIFREPWQAQAFAMTLTLHQAGHFSWQEWADYLSAEISAAKNSDLGDRYYHYWLAALEKISVDKGLLLNSELIQQRSED